MANAYKLYKVCDACNGTGVQTKTTMSGDTPSYSEVTCQDCGGDKMKLWGWCTEAVFTTMPTEPE